MHSFRVFLFNIPYEILCDSGLVLEGLKVIVSVIAAGVVFGSLSDGVLIWEESGVGLIVFEAEFVNTVSLGGPWLGLLAVKLLVFDDCVEGVDFQLDGGLNSGFKFD